MTPDLYTPYQRDNDGGLLNPPVIPDMERAVTDAAAGGDPAQLESVMEQYNEKRDDIARRHNARVDARRREDERLLAQSRQDTDRENRERAEGQMQQERRERAEALRQAQAIEAEQRAQRAGDDSAETTGTTETPDLGRGDRQ